MVNACPKLYFINNAYNVVLYTDASDDAQGAYLCQIAPTGEGEEMQEEPIRFLVAHLVELKVDGQQSKRKLMQSIGRLTRGNRVHYQNRPQEPLKHEHAWIKKVLQWKLDIQHYNMEKAEATVHHIMVSSDARQQLIKECHEWLCALRHSHRSFFPRYNQ